MTNKNKGGAPAGNRNAAKDETAKRVQHTLYQHHIDLLAAIVASQGTNASQAIRQMIEDRAKQLDIDIGDERMKDTRVFKVSEVDSDKRGWYADLSDSDAVNPDAYWWFATKAKARQFVVLVDNGTTVRDAVRKVDQVG